MEPSPRQRPSGKWLLLVKRSFRGFNKYILHCRLNQVPVVRSPSITSSHLNAVAPLVRIKRINSEAETIYRLQSSTTTTTTTSRVTSVVPSPKGSYKSSGFRGLKVFSDRKVAEPKKASPPPQQQQILHVSGLVAGTRRTSPPVSEQPKRAEGYQSSSNGSQQQKSKGERLEEQRQRREFRKRENLTTTPNIRARPTTIFDSLTKRR